MIDLAILAGLPGSVQAELSRRGVQPEALARAIEFGDGDALLLTGSYATGEQNPTSDLDLLVLTQGRARARPPGATNHPSTLGDSFDVIIGDLAVNIEYVSVARAFEVCALIDAVSAETIADLPNLQPLEVRLVQRIAIGIPLAGDDLISRVRSGERAEIVRASAAALGFVMAVSLLEDAHVLASPASELMCRGAAESLLLSGINAFGMITYDIKHLVSRSRRLAERPGAPRLFAEWEKVLFADRIPLERARDYLLDVAADLYRAFGTPGCPAQVLPMLAPFRQQWMTTGRALGDRIEL